MNDDRIKVGENYYTPSQYQAIEELFGEGFLEDNPYFPSTHASYKIRGVSGTYGGFPPMIQERQREEAKRNKEKIQRQQAAAAIKPTLLEVWSASGHPNVPDSLVIRVRGNSENDCREKFVRKHIKSDNPNWQAEYKEYLRNWCYERFVNEDEGVIE